MRRSLRHCSQRCAFPMRWERKARERCQRTHVSLLKCQSVSCGAEFGSADVAVVGGGIMGLTTALLLKQQFSNISVDIIAEKSYSESTSHGAAGVVYTV